MGIWWLYDASQAVFGRDTVKVFGLAVPGLGVKGIAAGSLASDVPDKKHMRFLWYALALFFGGIFGLDSFITGNKRSGIIRAVSLITVIFAPLAIGWWLYNLFRFFFSTKKVINKNWEYFGAPPLKAIESDIFDTLSGIFPFLAPLFGSAKVVKNVTTAVIQDPTVILKGPLGQAVKIAAEAASPVVVPISAAVQSTANAVGSVAAAAESSIDLARASVETASQIGHNVAATVQPLVEMAGQAATLQASITPNAITKAATESLRNPTGTVATALQQGGAIDSAIDSAIGSSNAIGYVLFAVIGLVAVSGFAATYRRSKKNAKPERNDAPPIPGVL